MKVYIADVRLAIKAQDKNEACDWVSEALGALAEHGLIDWSYAFDLDANTWPTPYPAEVPDDYEEGDAFQDGPEPADGTVRQRELEERLALSEASLNRLMETAERIARNLKELAGENRT
jgi:hypothetical protein